MRAVSRLWFSGAAWMAPTAVGLGVILLSANDLPGYPSATTAGVEGAWPIMGIAPVVATGAAITGAALRNARWHTRPTARSTPGLLAETVWPHAAAGVLALVVTTVLALLEIPYAGVPDLRPLAAAVGVVVAAAVLGYAVGLWCWTPLALALASGGTFYLLAFRVTTEPLWLRHLGGVDECCQVYETLSNRVPAATLLTSAAAVVVGGAAVALRRERSGVPLLGAVGAVPLVVVSVGLVSGMGASPATLRTGDMTCRQGIIEYCVWPEQASRLDQVMAVGDQVLGSVGEDTGVPLPSMLTTSRATEAVPGARSFEVVDSEDDLDVALELGSAAAPALTERCAARVDHVTAGEDTAAGSPEDASRLLESLWAANSWWQIHALTAMGADAKDAAAVVLGPDVSQLSSLLDRPPAEQAAWLTAVDAAAERCEIAGAPGIGSAAGAS